jgi:hypothetical protein
MTTDYHDHNNIDTPKEERRKYNIGDIWINSAQCLKCGDIIRSKNRLDFKWCKCGNIAVDGGSWHASRVCKEEGTCKNIIVMFNDVKKGE